MLYKFRREGEPEPKPEPEKVEPEVAPFPEFEGALTVEEYYKQNGPPQKRREVVVKEWHVDEDHTGWTEVAYPHSYNKTTKTWHSWWGWRYAKLDPDAVYILPVVVDLRQPVAQMRDPL